ncbi:hypothetical protein [Schlesneria sp.]|uniref:hypothetical protein n=1 Tax=Schlesneria sp. TaxID=2762018 RepID=UPI002F009104
MQAVEILPIEQRKMIIGWDVSFEVTVDFTVRHAVRVLVEELPVPRMPTTHQILHIARIKSAPPKPPKPLKKKRVIVPAEDRWTTAHDHAQPVALQYGLSVDLVVAALPDAMAMLNAERDEIAPAIETARQITGLTPSKIERIENAYLDHSTIPHFDEHAQELAYSHPELGWNPSEDCSLLLWELLKRPIPKRANRYSEVTLTRAAEIVVDRSSDEVVFGEWSDSEPAFEDDFVPF